MPEGPHPHVVGVDDFRDAGATTWRDPARETRGHASGFPSLLWVNASLSTVLGCPSGPLRVTSTPLLSDSGFIHSYNRVVTPECLTSTRPWARRKEHGPGWAVTVSVLMGETIRANPVTERHGIYAAVCLRVTRGRQTSRTAGTDWARVSSARCWDGGGHVGSRK